MRRVFVWFFCITFILAGSARAAVIVLHNGQEVNAEITERDNERVIVNVNGVPVTYYLDEVSAIDGVALEVENEAFPENNTDATAEEEAIPVTDDPAADKAAPPAPAVKWSVPDIPPERHEEAASHTVKVIGQAIETFYAVNGSRYPADISELTGAKPPYLQHDYCGGTFFGYTFTCEINENSYRVTAEPAAGSVGKCSYSIFAGSGVEQTCP